MSLCRCCGETAVVAPHALLCGSCLQAGCYPGMGCQQEAFSIAAAVEERVGRVRSQLRDEMNQHVAYTDARVRRQERRQEKQ